MNDDHGSVGSLTKRIVDDLKILARDEVALAKAEVTKSAKKAAVDGASIALGGLVAVIGMAMLFVAAVPALEGVIPSLALRLLLVSVAYLAIGGIVAALFAKRLKRDAVPDMKRVKWEAQQTVSTVKQEVRHA